MDESFFHVFEKLKPFTCITAKNCQYAYQRHVHPGVTLNSLILSTTENPTSSPSSCQQSRIPLQELCRRLQISGQKWTSKLVTEYVGKGSPNELFVVRNTQLDFERPTHILAKPPLLLRDCTLLNADKEPMNIINVGSECPNRTAENNDHSGRTTSSHCGESQLDKTVPCTSPGVSQNNYDNIAYSKGVETVNHVKTVRQSDRGLNNIQEDKLNITKPLHIQICVNDQEHGHTRQQPPSDSWTDTGSIGQNSDVFCAHVTRNFSARAMTQGFDVAEDTGTQIPRCEVLKT